MKFLKQSTVAVVPMGPFLNPTDGVTLVASLVSALDNATTGIFCIKNGGSGAVRHATVTATTYDAYGMYLVTLDATDTGTLGRLRVYFAAAASCLPVWEDFQVLPATMFDSLVTGAGGSIPGVVAGGNGGLPTTNGTKLNQTADLTGGQSIAASSVPAVTLANGAHGGAAATISLQTPIAATVPDTQKVDVETIKTRAVTCGAAVTVLASVGAPAAPGAAGGLPTVAAGGLKLAQTVDLTAGQSIAASSIPSVTLAVGETGTGLTALGDTRLANLNATVASRSSHSAADVWAVATRTLSGFGTLVADIATAVWGATVRTLSAFGFALGFATPTNVTDAAAAVIAELPPTPPTPSAIADQVWDEAIAGHVAAGSTGAKLNGVGPGAGVVAWPYTVTNSVDGLPIADVDVWVTTDLAGTNVISSGKTNSSGIVILYPDVLSGTTIYIWRQKTGWDFTNPDVEVF
jgi:hypothetical protein